MFILGIIIIFYGQMDKITTSLDMRKSTGPRGYKTCVHSQTKTKSAMIGCLRTRVRKQPIIALYFEPEIVLKFYNLEATCLRVTRRLRSA